MSSAAPMMRNMVASKVQTMCFSVFAHAEPAILPKLCQPVAKRGLMISRLHAVVDDETQELQMDFQVKGIDQKLAQQMAQAMRQFPDVTCVLVSEKG
ncbi:hypothetical protein RYZ26_19130 [Terasakiella sp. A23]|uniref:hypothetical protein n=1 Tax=Terasakiella sp. FCG-A23 TaxID=3080561 RepID=UPI002955259A|nr:hypothetical protein [Terasakiella sp. A23]MDV7341723.1 hypothetical protein [Terasakiella sp. A23]